MNGKAMIIFIETWMLMNQPSFFRVDFGVGLNSNKDLHERNKWRILWHSFFFNYLTVETHLLLTLNGWISHSSSNNLHDYLFKATIIEVNIFLFLSFFITILRRYIAQLNSNARLNWRIWYKKYSLFKAN